MGNVQRKKVVNSFTVPKATLQVRIRIIPESNAVRDFERTQEGLGAIDVILTYLNIEDKKLVKTTATGLVNAEKGTRTFLINTKNTLSGSLILTSAVKLKDFKALKVYIISELSKKDAEKENNCLKERRHLIDQGSDPKTIRIKELTLEVLEGKTWTKRNETGQSNSDKWAEGAWLRESTILTFNNRSILNVSRRMKMSNSIVHSDYDIICLCEAWLTEDVTTASIFLENYDAHRNDMITAKTRKSRQGWVLITVKNHTAQEFLTTKCLKSDYLVMKNSLHGRTLVLCFIYSAPEPSFYQWTSNEFPNLMQVFEDIKSANELD